MRCAAWNDSSRNAYDFDCDVKDPSFVIHPNGTTVIAYRGVVSAMRAIALQLVNVHRFRMDRDVQTNNARISQCCEPCHDHTESVALLVAPQWNATYARVGVPLFIDNEVRSSIRSHRRKSARRN